MLIAFAGGLLRMGVGNMSGSGKSGVVPGEGIAVVKEGDTFLSIPGGGIRFIGEFLSLSVSLPLFELSEPPETVLVDSYEIPRVKADSGNRRRADVPPAADTPPSMIAVL